jgi:hypothetical protein
MYDSFRNGKIKFTSKGLPVDKFPGWDFFGMSGK